MKYSDLVITPALRQEAYTVLIDALLNGADQYDDELLTGAAAIVIEDDRKSRTANERMVQTIIASIFLVDLITQLDDAEPQCP